MANILLTTCQTWPNFSRSDQLVAEALIALGHAVQAVPWQDDFARFQTADLVILRSNWDYHYQIAAFAAWLDRVEQVGIALHNSAALVRWNLHKSYLLQLAEQGIKIPLSRLLLPLSQPEPLYQEQNWRSAVIKPIYGASGHLVARVEYDDLAAWQTQTRSQRAEATWLIQEFLPEIAHAGEISLIFLAGRFSHAVAKQPQAGEFRINSQYQGQIVRVQPAPLIVEQARRVLAALPAVPLYARVDGVVQATGAFCLIELELNEPALYFQFAPEQAVEFARVIDAQLA